MSAVARREETIECLEGELEILRLITECCREK